MAIVFIFCPRGMDLTIKINTNFKITGYQLQMDLIIYLLIRRELIINLSCYLIK